MELRYKRGSTRTESRAEASIDICMGLWLLHFAHIDIYGRFYLVGDPAFEAVGSEFESRQGDVCFKVMNISFKVLNAFYELN
jgi:hypothetical protein